WAGVRRQDGPQQHGRHEEKSGHGASSRGSGRGAETLTWIGSETARRVGVAARGAYFLGASAAAVTGLFGASCSSFFSRRSASLRVRARFCLRRVPERL